MPDIGVDAGGNVRFSAGRLLIVRRREAVKQTLRIRLLTMLGEWFRDRTEGVDYRGEILIRDFSKTRTDREVRRIVLTTPGVQSIQSITVTRSDHADSARITVRYRDQFGPDTQTLEVNAP